MEHTNQVAWCMTRPSIDPASLSWSRPQPAHDKIPSDGCDLEPRLYQAVQHWQLVRMVFFPACGCVSVAPLRVDIVEMFPSSSECAFRDVVVVNASDIGTRDFHLVVPVRDTQSADMPVPLRCGTQRKIPIARMRQQQHNESVPCRASRT
jgi:hypothetical protein